LRWFLRLSGSIFRAFFIDVRFLCRWNSRICECMDRMKDRYDELKIQTSKKPSKMHQICIQHRCQKKKDIIIHYRTLIDLASQN
jgi:hypothetical protein